MPIHSGTGYNDAILSFEWLVSPLRGSLSQ